VQFPSVTDVDVAANNDDDDHSTPAADSAVVGTIDNLSAVFVNQGLLSCLC